MVVTYYIKLLRTTADRHNGILMSLLLLIAETKMNFYINTVMTPNCNTLARVDKCVNHSDEYVDHRI